MTNKKFVNHLIVPLLAPALIVSLYFTPKYVFGCRNRGLMALTVVLAALVASIFTACRSASQKKLGNTEEAVWWLVSTLILLLPLILLVGPLK